MKAGGLKMKKLQKEFIEFNKSIKCSETDALIDKRDMLKKDIEDKFPDNCTKYGIEINKSDLEFINQGSYKIGTAIDSDNVDIDYAVIFPLDINEFNDPRNVKKAVRDSLFIENKRIPKIKEPCVTVAYHENDKEYMHIDFPVYASNNGLLYLGRGKEHSESYEWENADPKGLSEYFLNEFKDREQLKRIVRYIKKWKQIKYQNSNNSHEVPPSVGLTILACNYYFEYTYEGDDDLSSFYYTMRNIKNAFTIKTDEYGEITSADIICDLPVVPYSDVFYKMRQSKDHLINFYKKINKAVNNLKEAINLDEEHEAAKYVREVLGDQFTVPEKKTSSTETSSKSEYNYG